MGRAFPRERVERGGGTTGGGGSSSPKQTIYKKQQLHVARLRKAPRVTQTRTLTAARAYDREREEKAV